MANPIDENDRLAMAVGRAAGRWALVENAIESLFLQMIGTDTRRASIVFRFFRNTQMQRGVVSRLAALYLSEKQDLQDELTELLKRFGNLAEQRNELLHNAFGYDTTDQARPIYQMRRSTPGADFIYERHPSSVADIEAFAGDARTLFGDLMGFSRKVSERFMSELNEQMKALLEKHPEPSVDLGQGLLGGFLRPAPNEEHEPPPPSSLE